jgi:tetratricopeptide (TPR) repeat protein
VIAALLLALAQPAPTSCQPGERCAQASAAQLFAAADELFAKGQTGEAIVLLEALTQDRHVELRSEARFRLAAVYEKIGDLDRAVAALRALLAEQPEAGRARLELARLLAATGDKRGARAELERAQQVGLPEDVAATVRQFSTTLAPARRRGLSLELASGPDSNINRATGSQYIDTIIAPFELSPDARRQSGIGATLNAQAWSRNAVGPVEWLTSAQGRASLFSKPRFNDYILSADSGPEFSGNAGTIRPALTLERRWFGDDGYSKSIGAALNWRVPLGARTQGEIGLSRARQTIDPNPNQSGWVTSADLALTRALGPDTMVRGAFHLGWLDAKTRPDSLSQWGADVLVTRRFGGFSLFGQAGYSSTRGRGIIFLFGERRRDRRIDLSAGVIFNRVKLGGFAPLLRVAHSDSQADIVLYDYKRTRLDIGFTRAF